ncbi:MAG: hypothetical protein DWQ07_12800 [Chloroflexi bacterium]|nr:MAG: hypothetical protein DWQ07_12800 [Chloroflexota bacterium]MBL1196918.1 hypothetical protein [Chloroflexota bacterium]NOH14214.1 hypothetical protein [Chloroflexota bacterium]
MSAQLIITDGIKSVSLLDAAGFAVLYGKWSPGRAQPTVDEIVAAIGQDGAFVTSANFENVTERFDLKLTGTSHDDMAFKLQMLEELLEGALDHQEAASKYRPVYLVAQTDDETNPRYSEVLWGSISYKRNWREMDFVHQNVLRDIMFTIRRKPYWHSVPPETVPSPLSILTEYIEDEWAAAGDVLALVGNLRQTSQITHIFNFDDDLAAWSGNLVNDAGFDLFEVSGSTPALDDVVFFGSTDGPFFNFLLSIGTLGDFSATLLLEYWNGAAWTNTNSTPSTTLLKTGSITAAGKTYVPVSWNNNASDWATRLENGVTAYWLRLRISAFTSWTTTPAVDQVVRAANNNYIEIGQTQIPGDVKALAMLRMVGLAVAPTDDTPEFIAMGLKTTGLANFESMINAVNENPANWSVGYGTDTASAADSRAAGNAHALCTFTTQQNILLRAQFIFSSSDEIDYAGSYRVYLRCQQVGGNAGDVSVRLDYSSSNVTTTGEVIPLSGVEEGIELVDVGRYTLFPDIPRGGEDSGVSSVGMNFTLYASAVSATPNLEIFGIVLIPVDEWSLVTTGFGGLNEELQVFNAVQLDGGILREDVHRTRYFFTDPPFRRPAARWQIRGELPVLKPKRQGRIYFVFGSYPSSGSIIAAGHGLGLMAELMVAPRWKSLRGAA